MGYLTDPPTDEQIDRLIRERYNGLGWKRKKPTPTPLSQQIAGRILAWELAVEAGGMGDDYQAESRERRKRAEDR